MQSLGLVSFILIIFGLAFLVLKWPQSIHKTFSAHAAAYRHTIIYYIVFFSIVLPLLVSFFVGWFVPHFHLSVWFSVCIVVSSVFQYFAACIPEVGGWKTTYHRVLSFWSVIFLLPPIVFVIFADSISPIGRLAASISLPIMLGIIGVVAVRRNKQRYHLLLQTGYYVAFFVAILTATYF